LLALTNLEIRQFANQAAQSVVSQKKIKPQKIPVPSLKEQRRIVKQLNGPQAKTSNYNMLRRFSLDRQIDFSYTCANM
jgi:restriction endonuclease S subunit